MARRRVEWRRVEARRGTDEARDRVNGASYGERVTIATVYSSAASADIAVVASVGLAADSTHVSGYSDKEVINISRCLTGNKLCGGKSSPVIFERQTRRVTCVTWAAVSTGRHLCPVTMIHLFSAIKNLLC